MVVVDLFVHCPGCEVANRCSKVKGVGEKVVDGEQFSTYAPDSSVVSVCYIAFTL